jgi:hypothetical protein
LDGKPSKEFQVLQVLLRHYGVTVKPENFLGTLASACNPATGKQSSYGVCQAPLIKRSLEGEIHCTDHLDGCIGYQATYSCSVEAQVMHILFSLILHVTHHAFYEDYSTLGNHMIIYKEN